MDLATMLHTISIALGYKEVEQEKYVPPWDLVDRQLGSDRVSKRDILDMLKNYRVTNNGFILQYRDKTKVKVDIEKLKEYIEVDTTDQIMYISEDEDCDDFTDILKGMIKRWDSRLAIGFMLVYLRPGDIDGDVGYHALLCCVSEDGKLMSLEPQSDKIKDIPLDWEIQAIYF